MPSPLRHWRSVPVGTGLTQPLAWFIPGLVGRGPPQSPSRQGWHHYHRLISHPRPHHGNGASAPNPKLTDRLTRGTWECNSKAMHGTRARGNIAIGRDTVATLGGRGEGARRLRAQRTTTAALVGTEGHFQVHHRGPA
jgi:hypothetical protein